MRKFTEKITHKIVNFNQRLQNILENDFQTSQDEISRIQNTFQMNQNESYISALNIALPTDHIDKAIVLFSRLSLVFPSGLLLENHDNSWRPQAYFHKGFVSTLRGESKSVNFKLPQISPLEVIRTNSKNILTKIQMENLDPDGKMICLMFKPTNDFSFLVFTDLPDLWLKDLTEKVNQSIYKSFCS